MSTIGLAKATKPAAAAPIPAKAVIPVRKPRVSVADMFWEPLFTRLYALSNWSVRPTKLTVIVLGFDAISRLTC